MTKVTSMQKAKVRSQRSMSRGQNPTYLFTDRNSSLNSHMMINNAQSLILLKRSVLFFSRSSVKFQGHMG